MTTWAEASDIEVAANSWSDGQIACRVYGHNWRPLTVRHRPGVFTILQRCNRCSNERQQQINEQGFPLDQWRMTYRDGYLLKNLGRVGQDGRAVLRLKNLTGLYIEEEPEE